MVIGLGALSMGMAFVRGPTTFLILRSLLGVAEAGFFPGVILYLTYWFPIAYRSRIIAAFMMAIPASLAIAGPISNAILHMSGVAGIKGWQWLFIMEGAPTIVLGAAMFFILPDRPRSATWLSKEQKDWLTTALARKKLIGLPRANGMGLRKAFSDPSVLTTGFSFIFGEYHN